MEVRHTIAVRSTIRGESFATAVVVQQLTMGLDGCRPNGAGACDPAFSTTEDVWAVRRLADGTFERASSCTERLIREILRV